jgi:predicted  nucleic acid-binding Zn-ribbon protein
MLPEIEQLLVIQDRDQKIKAHQIELTSVPLERQRVEQTLKNRVEAFDQIKLRAKEIEVHRKKLELDANSRRDTIGKYKTQQSQTRKNEEFQTLGQSIARLEHEIEQIEDQEIELMEQGEVAAREIQQAEAELKASKTQTEQHLAALAKKQETLDQRLRETAAERETLAAAIDPDLLSRYQRLFTSKNGTPIVPVEHEVCMGCHMKNTTTTVHRVKLAREIVYCEQCGRILY